MVEGVDGPAAQIGEQQLPLAPLAELNNCVGRDIIVGVRPEFAEITASDTAQQIKINLDLVETLGSEALLHATLGEDQIVLRTSTLEGVNDLQHVTGFTIQPNLIKLFDGQTGMALAGQVRNA